MKQSPIPLIIQEYPPDYDGYPFITLIQYKKEHTLTIVDNYDARIIRAFVLDLCGPERVSEQVIVDVATEWYNANKTNYPISIEFARRNLTTETGKIYRIFNIEFVTRVIGPLPKFDMNEIISIKRKRKKPISPQVEIHKKVITFPVSFPTT